MIDLGALPLILSPNRGTKAGKDVERQHTGAIILHTTQGHERVGSARGVAQHWFALPKSGVSCQLITDPTETILAVPLDQIAWHAGKANTRCIGIEICGKAEQNGPTYPGSADGEWFDDDSLRTLDRLCDLIAVLCIRYNIEPRRLTPSELARIIAGDLSITGIAGHVDVPGATHRDPGKGFPWLQVLIGVRARLGLPA